MNKRLNYLYSDSACLVLVVAILNFNTGARSASARSGTKYTEIARSLLGFCTL